MTEETAAPRPRRGMDVPRVVGGIFALQLVLAVALIVADIGPRLPTLFSPSDAPRLTQPVTPGDQTRRLPTRDAPLREADPGARPLPSTPDMPSRLLFETATWEGRPALLLTGQIAPGDAGRLTDRLEADPTPPEIVFLNSPGGSVEDALIIGRALRALGVETRLTATDICLSACPYIFAAGATRTADPEALLGVHQHFFGENTALPAFLAVEDIQRGQGEVMGYLIEMGIDPAVMRHALVTPPDEIYLLTPDERTLYGFTTPAE